MGLEFRELEGRIIGCRRCPRLVAWREKVAREKVRRFRDQEYWGRPVPAFGDPDAALVIVGLAPAAHGGNRTGRMFTGDRSGDWLYEALFRSGLAGKPESVAPGDGLVLRDCLITAAVRCAPPGNKPLPEEMDNCREYLRRELQLDARKRVVIALGRIAFDTLFKISRQEGMPAASPKPEFRHEGEYALPGGVMLIASYHPSQQNTQTGRLTRPMFHRIFRRARALVDRDS